MAEYFTNIVGNTALRTRLAHDILNGSLPHAYIIEGREGSGRRTLALNIAAALCCRDRDADRFPCLECLACRKILGGKTPDVIRIKAESGRAGIGVDASRFIRTDAMTVPNDFDFKIYIIEGADTMTPQAQNALLLTLEEPHSYAVFFLIVNSASALLETVRSRAPIIRTESVDDKTLADYIISHDERARALSASRDEFAALLTDARGSVGRALKLLDPKERKPGADRRRLAEEFVRAFASIRSSDTAKLEMSCNFSGKRDEVIVELEVIGDALRDLILLKKSESAPLCFYFDREEAIDLADHFTIQSLFALHERVCSASDALSRNANLRLTITSLILG